MAPPVESPTKRIPSGPNVKTPADLISGLPALRLSVKAAEKPVAVNRAITNTAQKLVRNLVILPPKLIGIRSKSHWTRLESSGKRFPSGAHQVNRLDRGGRMFNNSRRRRNHMKSSVAEPAISPVAYRDLREWIDGAQANC